MREKVPRKHGPILAGLPVRKGTGRNVLLIGFLLLLLLIALAGHLARKNFAQVEGEIAALHQTEAKELQLVLGVAELVGKMITEARVVIGTRDESFLHGPSARRLRVLKDEMSALIDRGRQMAIGHSAEWKKFESAFDGYWTAVMGAGSPQATWDVERNMLLSSVWELEDLTRRRHEANDLSSLQLSANAQRKVGALVVVVLMVGVVVAGLTFYEMRRVVERLNRAYGSSAESRDYLQSLVNGLVSGLVVLDMDGIVATVNGAFAKFVGSAKEDPVGESYTEAFQQNEVLSAFVADRLRPDALQGRDSCRVELTGRLFDVFASPLVIGDKQRGLILIFVDISDVERAQTELRRNRALTAVGQMTAQIAHEIKNPLGSIRFAAEILKRRLTDDEEHLEVIEIIGRSVDHLASIVNELCEFSRPRELNRAHINLNSLLDDVLPMVADRLTEKDLSVEKSYSHRSPTGSFDISELRKLFLNLIINAIDASDQGDTILVRTLTNGAGDVSVQIVDRGCGMDPETQRRLFEPFYTTKPKGTGLGMPIAKKIAELHGGDLIVNTREGQGTTITVRLPAGGLPKQPESLVADNGSGQSERQSN